MKAGTYLERVFRETEDANRRRILMTAEPRAGCTLLDLGCGTGEFTLDVARRVQAGRVLGLELVDHIAEAARANGVEATVGDLGGRLPYDDASVDVVHSNQVIEHLPDTDTFLKEIRRVLRPDGYAVVSTNNLSSWHNIASLVMGWQPTPCHVSDEVIVGNPANFVDGTLGYRGQTHLRVFTGRALAGLAAFHGLAVQAQHAAGYYPLSGRVAGLAARLDARHGAFLVQRYGVASSARSAA